MKNLILIIFLFSISICSAQDVEIHFDHYAILVKDLDSTVTFYQEVIGLEETEDKTEQDHIRWFSMGEKTELHIIENKEYKIPDEKGIHFALRVNDLDTFIKNLIKHRIKFQNWFGLVGKTI